MAQSRRSNPERRALEVLFSDVAPATLNQRLIAAACEVFPVEIASLNSFDLSGSMMDIDLVTPKGAITAALQGRFRELVFQHPVHRWALQGGLVARELNRPVRLTDHVTSEFWRSALFNEFFRKVEVNQQLMVSLRHDRHVTVLALNRWRTKFSDREVSALASLHPWMQHAANASAGVTAYLEACRRGDGVISISRSSNHASVVADERARELLATHSEASGDCEASSVLDGIVAWAVKERELKEKALEPPAAGLRLSALTIKRAVGVLTAEAFAVPGTKSVRVVISRESPCGKAVQFVKGRPREVMDLVAEGLSNEEIAQALSLSPRTVDNHVSDALRRLGVKNRTAAAVAWVTSRSAQQS